MSDTGGSCGSEIDPICAVHARKKARRAPERTFCSRAIGNGNLCRATLRYSKPARRSLTLETGAEYGVRSTEYYVCR